MTEITAFGVVGFLFLFTAWLGLFLTGTRMITAVREPDKERMIERLRDVLGMLAITMITAGIGIPLWIIGS